MSSNLLPALLALVILLGLFHVLLAGALVTRSRGMRWTPQRRTVVEVLAASSGHVTSAELIERCRERDPQTIPSTVYRTLDALEQLGLVRHGHGADGREEFHVGPYTTAVGAGELLTEVRLPVRPGAGSAHEKVERRAGDWAIAAASAVVWIEGGSIVDAGIALPELCHAVTRAGGGDRPEQSRFADAARAVDDGHATRLIALVEKGKAQRFEGADADDLRA